MVHSRGRGLLAAVAVVVAVVVPVGRGAAVQNVQGDVTGGGAKHQQAALTQGGVVVAAVTEGTLLQTGEAGRVKGQAWLVAAYWQVSRVGGSHRGLVCPKLGMGDPAESSDRQRWKRGDSESSSSS